MCVEPNDGCAKIPLCMGGARNAIIVNSLGRADGQDTYTGIMILALATRHRVERPAISMEGGTLIPMERPCPPLFETPEI